MINIDHPVLILILILIQYWYWYWSNIDHPQRGGFCLLDFAKTKLQMLQVRQLDIDTNAKVCSQICCKRSAKHAKTAKISIVFQEFFTFLSRPSFAALSLFSNWLKWSVPKHIKYYEEKTGICKIGTKNVSFTGSLFLSTICWEPSLQINWNRHKRKCWLPNDAQNTEHKNAAHRKWVVWNLDPWRQF